MKYLIFNLLQDRAARTGCVDEAWELVVEFTPDGGWASTEAAAAEASAAVLACLGAGSVSVNDDEWASDDRATEPAPPSSVFDLGLDAAGVLGHRCFKQHAFTHPERLLSRLDAIARSANCRPPTERAAPEDPALRSIDAGWDECLDSLEEG